MSDLVPIRRALLSVSDKTGLVEFARALHGEFGVELISTGGTAKALREADLPVTDVSQVTGFPEMMDGRLKTLHPLIHGGLLALRDDPQHVASMQAHGIAPIDLLCVNLYPFSQTVARPGCTFEDAIENIDIGGPAMIRAAAKNHRFVLVVTSPDRYDKVLGDLREHKGSCCGKHRLKQAQRAFAHTAEYDAAIAEYLQGAVGSGRQAVSSNDRPPELALRLRQKQPLRYGENPHQQAGLYVDPSADVTGTLAAAEQLHGKELSFINLLDADAALACARDFSEAAACIVKHATPCGVAIGTTPAEAFARAYEADPVAAFGGIVAINRAVDLATAEAIVAGQKFLEVIVAPSYAGDALELLRSRWKNVRLLACGAGVSPAPAEQGVPDDRGTRLSIRSIDGGFLVQESDRVGPVESEWKVVSKRPPTESERSDLRFAWLACKHVKSNAIVVARGGATVGIGGGQVDRVGAARIATEKAGQRARGGVAASDAFFPFADGPRMLLDAGVSAIIQPGGSVRDKETIAAVDEAGAAMILTGRRHFRH